MGIITGTKQLFECTFLVIHTLNFYGKIIFKTKLNDFRGHSYFTLTKMCLFKFPTHPLQLTYGDSKFHGGQY